uniref:Alpha-2-macroglobulin-like n=1 Tax=Sinocyclocheilus anshuiensis TaxID=1608454 RepID=A0A671NTP6_9TELE
MVTFPAVIESGSEAKLCASLLKPNESLAMNIYLVHGDQSTLLLQEKAEEEFHRCFNFNVLQDISSHQAPLVEAESVQRMKVELHGESFKMTEERKVMFKSYNPLTFIQTDKPIYNPGQTVNFRVVTVDTNFAPLDQQLTVTKYLNCVFGIKQDNQDNRIGQWTNVSSTRWILQRSYELNPEARQGVYRLRAYIGERIISHDFEVKKYVLPKFEVIVQSPDKVSVDEEELLIEVCGNEYNCCMFIGYVQYYSHPLGSSVCYWSVICLFQVLSRGVIVHHGSEKVEVKSSNGAASDTVSFKLSVGADLAPAVQILAYCVLPSENVAAGNTKFDVEKCFSNKVSLQFSPAKAVPGEKNTLQLSAQPGSLCGLSAVDQSVLIMESGKLMYRHHVPKPVAVMSSLADADFHTSSRDSPAVTIRTVFPETWIWELAEVGDSGSVQVPVTVPDTITSWETEAFCLSSKGLGLAPPAQLTVFQPFFLELSLPYSIIRGEIFELKATVFNYLSKCIMVKVTPAASSDYTLKASADDQYSSCLCANGRKTFKWILTPSVLGVMNITVSAEAEASQTVCDNEIVSVPERGRIDIVTRSLLVQAEGTEKTETYSWLLCPKGDSLSEEVNLTLPKDVIEGSAKSSVSVIGDILGRALRNLHGLLRMPYGCGEQNMAILSPNIYILQYLENTEQLTSAIRERATGFLKSGYQRQLNYKHFDGAYSTFGHGDGNTWLTAFVLRSFGKAQKYIFIDPQIIQTAKQWLISRRDSDGCFIQQGRLFNNRMKVSAVSLFLLQDPVVTKGLSCLRSVTENVKNTYTTALLAYTFSLARDTDTRQQLFKKLEDVAISEGSHLHWSQSASDDSDSLAVEISSYVLLAALTADSLTTADLGFANRIVSWLVKQQNAYGGFSSTQDTVVALQALSLYATKVFSSDGSSTVTVQSAGDTHLFDVNQDNKLLYQEKQLQNVPAKYSIEVKGSTCVSVQVCSAFSFIDSLTFCFSCEMDYKSVFVCVDSLRWLSSTTFPLLLKLTSTFSTQLGTSSGTYASLIPKNIPMNYQIQMKQVLPVKNLKPAVVKVYDYYQTSKILYASVECFYHVMQIIQFCFVFSREQAQILAAAGRSTTSGGIPICHGFPLAAATVFLAVSAVCSVKTTLLSVVSDGVLK